MEPYTVLPNRQILSQLRIEFVEDEREFQCDRCENKLFEHYIANCGHKFCQNCKRLVGDGSKKWKCPQCQEYIITTVDKQDVEFYERIYNGEVYCSNKVYGCDLKCKLKNLWDHYQQCDKTKEAALPVEIKTTAEIKNIWDELLKMKNTIEQNKKEIDIDTIVTHLKDKNFECADCAAKNIRMENKFENFKVEMKGSIDNLKENVNGFTQQFETLDSIDASRKEKVDDLIVSFEKLKIVQDENDTYARNEIKKIETDVNTQKTITNLQTENTKLQLEKFNQSFEELKNNHSSLVNNIKSEIDALESKMKDQTDQNTSQILEVKQQFEKLCNEQQLETNQIVQKLNETQSELSKIEEFKKILNNNMTHRGIAKLSENVNAQNSGIMAIAQEYNIILLGETGTGKSSFINSFANYYQFGNLDEAIASKQPISLISSKCNITDKDGVEHLVEAGENDGNERTELGKSFTINCRSYKFQFEDVAFRLIDTPGVGDTEGEQADGDHLANILSFINNFDNLHAIGIILRNDETKMTDRFTYCLKMLLTNLNKTAINNIVFIFTFSQGNDFQPGNLKNMIKLFIEDEIKEAKLVLNRDIMYCLDNRSYEYLIAINQGVTFKDVNFQNQKKSWKTCAAEVTRLMFHISELPPHKVRESTSLNDARNFIKVINPFLTEILENIESNRNLLMEYRTNYEAEDETIKNTESNKELKQVEIKLIKLDEAVTYCKSIKCSQSIFIGGKIMVHYPQICCKGCTIMNGFRWFCTEMNLAGGCKKCGCNIGDHERQFHKTEKVYSDLLTPEAKSKIEIATSVKEKWNIQGKIIEEREELLEFEKTTIEDAVKKFAKFLQTNTLAKPPKSKSNETENDVMEKYSSEIAEMNSVGIDEVYQLKLVLSMSLPLNGKKISDVLNSNAAGLKRFMESTEKTSNYKKQFWDFSNEK